MPPRGYSSITFFSVPHARGPATVPTPARQQEAHLGNEPGGEAALPTPGRLSLHRDKASALAPGPVPSGSSRPPPAWLFHRPLPLLSRHTQPPLGPQPAGPSARSALPAASQGGFPGPTVPRTQASAPHSPGPLSHGLARPELVTANGQGLGHIARPGPGASAGGG
ncbi:hypothetical protein H1C71_018421 [Ictidomys tridecemlineatus]|nr:hypothetical protein H1C71_018421 [Ictidomys tridecemlineatus]